MQQRILTLLLGLVMMSTACCGFHPRGATQVTQAIKTLILDSPDIYGPLAHAVIEQLRINGITVIKNINNKNIPSLQILDTIENQNTVSIFHNGKTAEYEMILKIHTQLLLPGHEIYPLLVSVYRSLFDNPITAIAKDAEQDIIRQEMYNQAAQQLVSNLLTIYAATEKKSTTN
ncbi:LPS-assembly lipoprotein [Serratia symbiotica str. 'Cinara cedri']|nr:LPS-assembly lipoprotein [Serratia symbiotica str. 'Cinara cedri']